VERLVTGRTALGIDTANPEQAAAWNGHEGEHWAAHADRFERIGSATWRRLLDRDLVGRAERVLDVGCGTGGSTRDLGRVAVEGHALGVDLSAPMLTVARDRAQSQGLTNVDFVQADAQIHPFDPGAYDVVVSCFGAMFFADPLVAFTNIASALRADGTLAVLAWRELDRNEWITAIRAALAVGRVLPVPPPEAPTPFSLADPARVQSILGAAGFEGIELEPIDEAMVFGTDADDAYGFLQTMGIVEWLTHDLLPSSRAEALAQLRAAVEAHEQPGAVTFGSSAWLITARNRHRRADPPAAPST
jgi:SAM-dependent methyltransferase